MTLYGLFIKRVKDETRTRKELSFTGFTAQPANHYGTTITICRKSGTRTQRPLVFIFEVTHSSASLLHEDNVE